MSKVVALFMVPDGCQKLSWVELFMIQNPETRHRKEDIVHPLRQITTNPMKKGGYGFSKTTLSERKGYKGVVSFTCVPGWTIDSAQREEGRRRGEGALLGVFGKGSYHLGWYIREGAPPPPASPYPMS